MVMNFTIVMVCVARMARASRSVSERGGAVAGAERPLPSGNII
jgi:hypothetical protein